MRALYTWGCAAAIWLVASLTASAQTLSIGMSGSEVSSLQNDLVAAGYLARTVDGDYGSTTKEAVPYSRRPKACLLPAGLMMIPGQRLNGPPERAIVPAAA